LAEPLSQVGVPTGPIEDALQQHLGGLLAGSVASKPRGQWCRFLCREICQLDPLPDVERRYAGVTDEIRRRCHSQEAERQPLEQRMFRAPIVTLTNAGQELIRAEW